MDPYNFGKDPGEKLNNTDPDTHIWLKIFGQILLLQISDRRDRGIYFTKYYGSGGGWEMAAGKKLKGKGKGKREKNDLKMHL